MDWEDHWTLVGTRDTPDFLYARVRNRLTRGDWRHRYSQRLDIAWERQGGDELDEMGLLEDALVEGLEFDKLAVMTICLLSPDSRVWTFYCRDVDEAGRRVAHLTKDIPFVTVKAENDPLWSDFELWMKKIGASKKWWQFWKD